VTTPFKAATPLGSPVPYTRQPAPGTAPLPPVAPPPAAPAAPDPYANAFTMLQALLQSWGLTSLAGDVRDMLTAGDSADVIPIKLRETEAYKTRFKGNLDRVKNGLPALSEAEFLATETSLKSVVRRYVGAGEYDSKENLDKWIASDLSPQELNDRLGLYQENWDMQPREVKDAWASHGLTPRDALRALMDPTLSETTLKRQAAIYSLGGAGVQAFGDDRTLDTDRLGFLADSGVSRDEAEKGYRDIAGRQEYEGFLAKTAGVEFGLRDQEDAALLGDQRAEQRRRKILNTDTARFEENYLGTQSSLLDDRSGSY